jgi:hypothetical protein
MLRFLQNAERSAVLAAPAVALAVFVAGAAGAGARDPSFAPGAPIPGRALAVADFNKDGKSDLAVVRSGGITILLGDGAGGFTAAPGLPVKTGDVPAVADFNGDGNTDLAVVSGSQELIVLLGNGAGGFAVAAESPVKTGRLWAVADFDGDRTLDLLVGSGKLTILLGDGSGRFAAAPGSPFSSGSKYLSSIAVADFDGDGKSDLALGASEAKTISILRGKGDGRFGAATKIPLPAGYGVASLVVGDFNRDGKPDLVVATQYVGGGFLPRVTILLGNGRGGFRRASGSPIDVDAVEYVPRSIAVADLDGNGVPDVAVVADNVAVLLGNGKGGFRAAADSPFPISAPYQVVAGDFDGNRKIDLAVPSAQGVTILFQTRSAPAAVRSRKRSARPAAVFSTRAPVGLLAADGNRVASASCDRIVVWAAPGRKSTSLDTHSDPCDDLRGGLDELAIADGQVALIASFGGNCEVRRLFVASLSGGKVKTVDSAGPPEGPNLEGDSVGQLLGADKVLAYNHWSVVCNSKNPEGDCDGTHLGSNSLLRIVAGRRVVVKRGSYPLAAVGGGRMAVVSDGAVTVLAANGRRVATVAALERDATRAIALTRTRLAVERTFSLDLLNPKTGLKTKSLPLGPAAALELVGLSAKLALLRGSHRLVLVRLSDGKLISLPFHGVIDPKLTESGLFYAYNTPKAAMKGHIVFEPAAKLLARF